MTIPPTPAATPPTPAPAPPLARRRPGTVTSMALSLLVVCGFVLTIVGLTPRPDADPVRVIDPNDGLSQARATAPYAVYGPVGLPARWRATSARTERTGTGAAAASISWHLGFVTPEDRYAAVEQSNSDPAAFLAAIGENGKADGSVNLAGTDWKRLYREAKDQRTLWRTDGGSVVAVTGNASWAELEQLAAALRGP